MEILQSGARVFLNGCRTKQLASALIASSGARVFLNGCRTGERLFAPISRSGARVFLNGCRTCIAHIKLFFRLGRVCLSGTCVLNVLLYL